MINTICTVYDCEFDLYHKGVIINNKVYVLSKEGHPEPAVEHVCEYVDFDRVQFFTGSQHDVFGGAEKWGYFKLSTGEIVVPPTYDEAYPFYGDRAKVKRNKKYGFVNPAGEEIVKAIWDETSLSFRGPLCWVRKGNKYGYVDKQGQIIFQPQFEQVGNFEYIGESLGGKRYASIVKKDGKYGYVDEKGAYIFEPSFDDAKDFWNVGYNPSAGYAPVKAFEKWGFIDTKGDFAVAFQFDDVGENRCFYIREKANKEDLSIGSGRIEFHTVKKDGQWGLMTSGFDIIMLEKDQNFIIYKNLKIYIKASKVTSMRELKAKKA